MLKNHLKGLHEKRDHVDVPVQLCIIFKLDSILIDSTILNAINNTLFSNNYPMVTYE
jgi:hypothetical protein